MRNLTSRKLKIQRQISFIHISVDKLNFLTSRLHTTPGNLLTRTYFNQTLISLRLLLLPMVFQVLSIFVKANSPHFLNSLTGPSGDLDL